MYKKTTSTMITVLMMLTIFTNIGISDYVEVEKINDTILLYNELEIGSFMKKIRKNLTDIIDNEEYWQGRFFGTPGEIKASEILYKSLKGIVPKIEYNELKKEYRRKPGIYSKEDISLKIDDQIISDIEIFPMFTPASSEKVHKFENAEIVISPNIIYNTKCNKKINPPAYKKNVNHIYLIDMKNFQNDYDIYLAVLKLFCYTRINPKWPVADGFLCADYNCKTHFMPPTSNGITKTMCILPGFMISGELGDKIKKDLTANIGFYINQYNKKDFSSKNVIATIPGKTDEVIFIGSKLDSMPCRGAADDSGSMSIVWGLAKFFAENKIEPNYTLKFGAWAAEEFGLLGSKSYIETNPDENIKYYIGLGAIGYKNNTKIKKSDLHLNIHSSREIEPTLKDFFSNFDYKNKSGGYGEIVFKKNDPMIRKTDAGSFINKVSENVFSIDKGDYSTATHWYHRTGDNNNLGDVPTILDEKDINTVADLIMNLIKYLDSE